MEDQAVFRLALLVTGAAYIVPRFYYRWRASRSGPPGESELRNVSESTVRLLLMGISGLGADLLSVVWAINPSWIARSSLPLPLWLRWMGVAFGLVAVFLGYAAHRTLGTSYTATLKTLDDHRLVVQGVYRWVRHPMYASFFALLATNTLLTGSWLVGALGLLYSLLIIGRVSDEERMLLESFGDDYRRYMRQTGRFFPRLIP
jgi:protein-S-isoprenylcysteine O-methyltransferase Ste14